MLTSPRAAGGMGYACAVKRGLVRLEGLRRCGGCCVQHMLVMEHVWQSV